MTRTLFLTALLITSLLSLGQNARIIADANAQKRNVSGFHAIRISGGIDLYLNQGGDEAVAISASDPEVRDHIRTEVENGVLKIYLENKDWHFFDHFRNVKMKAYVSVKQLDAMDASGGSDIFIQDILRSDRLKVGLSGGSELKGQVAIGDLSLDQSGGADVFIKGTASNLSVLASGGSDLHAYDLSSDVCKVHSSGGSDVQITVNKELNVSASGGSDVYYKGACSVRQLSASGGSDVIKKG
jgi:putative autotransporter adhesin-like protein